MPNLSERSIHAHTSPIRKLAALAEQAKQSGKQVLHLNIGQPDIVTPEHATQAVRDALVRILAYSPSAGHASYREQLPKYYSRFGINIKPDDVLVTNGASEAVLFTLLACLDPGESVLAPEPLYANYLGFAGMAGVQIKPLPTSISDGFALPDVAAFRAAMTPDVKAVMLCNPNNPTGTLYPESMLRELGELIRERDAYLIVDEVYREFCYGDTPFFSALRLAGLEQHVIVIDSVSKRYSACGARVGAAISYNREVLAAMQKYAETRLSPPTYGQIFAEAALFTPDTYFETTVAEYRNRRDLLYKRLSQMRGVVCYEPQGAFYVFAQLPVDSGDAFCRWLLSDFEHNGQTVMLAPGSGFYATPDAGLQEVRFAYVLNTTDLAKAMDCLEVALEQYPGRVA
jgi:aspartate aminotransferase